MCYHFACKGVISTYMNRKDTKQDGLFPPKHNSKMYAVRDEA